MRHYPEQNLHWLLQDKYGVGSLSPRLNRKQWVKFLKDAARLKQGEPLDYIVGWKPFLNCKIDLRYRPLIPRPETECWVEKFITNLKFKITKLKVLDIFAGSGCIGIAALKNTKNTKVDFSEINPRFVKQIQLNLKINQIPPHRYRLIHSDVLKNIRIIRYDFILANPPYLSIKNKNKVQPEVLKYEPRKALFGGKNGMFYIKKFLAAAKKHLKTGGQIWMEFDPRQKPAIKNLAKKLGYEIIDFQKDQYKRWRYAILTNDI